MNNSETKTTRRAQILSRLERGLTLIEIIIVIVIIGLVLSFVLRGVFGGAQKAKAGLSKGILEQFKGELAVYQITNNSFPQSLSALGGNKDLNDAFGNPVQYKVTDGGRGYELTSLGADGKPGGSEADADITITGP